MDPIDLPPRRAEILAYLRAELAAGRAPSLAEIAEAFGFASRNAAQKHVQALVEAGLVEQAGGRSRGLRLPGGPAALLALPVLGRVAAGTPIEAISHASRNLSVPTGMIAAAARHYALEVKGDSMIDAGINNGDMVVIKEQSTADNGDIVVALIEGEEATLKTFRRRGATIALEAANPAYQTRLYQDHQVRVQGKLVGLIRTY